MLKGFELMGYIEGKIELTSPVMRQQNQLILIKLDLDGYIVIHTSTGRLLQDFGRDMVMSKENTSTQARQLNLRLQLQTVKKGELPIGEFITKVSVLKLRFIGRYGWITEGGRSYSNNIWRALKYESFVTAITTRYDEKMKFATLCELLMDQNSKLKKSGQLTLQKDHTPRAGRICF